MFAAMQKKAKGLNDTTLGAQHKGRKVDTVSLTYS